MLVQCLASLANWCGPSGSNPVHIDHQYRREGTYAGVSQTLWENHSLYSFNSRQSSDQWRVSPSQCWKQRTLDSGRHLRPVSRRFFGCWCCCLRLRGILLPVPVPGKTCRCQPVTAARKPFSSQFINEECLLHNVESRERWTLADTSDLCQEDFLVADAVVWGFEESCFQFQFQAKHAGVSQWPLRENRSLRSLSMKSVSFTMLKAEKAGLWQTPQTLRQELFLVADAVVWRLPGIAYLSRILYLSQITLPVPVPSKKEQSIEQASPCWKNIRNFITCASSKSCKSCQLISRSCSNPVHIDHKGTNAGVNQWPLWERHSLPTFHCCKGSDQWRVSPLECWPRKPRKPCVKKILGCWCFCLTASRNPCVTRNSLACSSSEPFLVREPGCLFRFENEQSFAQLLLSWKNKHLP